MFSHKRAAAPDWKHTTIHSALALAFANAVFVTYATAACVPATTTISTAVSKQTPCSADTVTVTSAGSVSGASAGKGSFNAFEYSSLGGALNNSGTISATPGAEVMYAIGVQIYNDLSGSLINSGTISATNTIGDGKGTLASGVFMGGNLSGQLTNNGTISATVRDGAGVQSAFGGYLNNIGGVLTNNGTIFATTTGDAAYSNVAIGVTASTLSGALNSSGTISATATGNVAYGNSAAGASVVTLSGALSNSGTISATAAGNVGNGNQAYGVSVDTLSGVLNNSGTISASVSSGGKGSYVYGISTIAPLDGTINNSGVIQSSATGGGEAYSVYSPGAGGKGTLNNLAGGQLIGNLLTGTGVAVNNAGTISLPSAGAGTSTIGGNYTQQAGGLLTLGAKDTGSYNSLTVSGTANFTASPSIGIRATPNNTLAVGDTLSAVVSAGTLTGPATYTVVGTPLFTFSGVKNGNGIDVTVTSKSTFAGVLGGSALGGTLDALSSGYTGSRAIDPLLDALYNLNSRAELGNAAQKLSPVVADGLTQSTTGAVQKMVDIVRARQDANGGLSSGDLFYGDRQIWFKPFGSRADQGDHGGVSGYDAKTFGMLFGADGEISKTTRVGLAFGYAHTDVDSNASGTAKQSGDVESYQLTAYGNYSLDERTDLGFQASYGYHRNDTKRVVTGLLTPSIAKGSYSGWSTHLGASLSRNYALNPATTLTPSLRADYLYLSNKGYTESGAGAMNLDVKNSSADAFILGADAKVSYALSETSKLTGNLGVGYDLINDRNAVTSAFVGGGAAFSTKGIDQSPWVILGGLGYVMTKNKNVEVSARYDFETRSSEFTNQTASINLRIPF